MDKKMRQLEEYTDDLTAMVAGGYRKKENRYLEVSQIEVVNVIKFVCKFKSVVDFLTLAAGN